jgi:hypothetical protein
MLTFALVSSLLDQVVQVFYTGVGAEVRVQSAPLLDVTLIIVGF